MRRKSIGIAILAGCLSSIAACDRNDLASGRVHVPAAPTEPGGTGNDPSDCDPPETIPLEINEVMVLNTKTLADENGEYPPWIELYNDSDAPVDLGKVSLFNLGNLGDDPLEWDFPCDPKTSIPARGFMVVFADGKDYVAGSQVHAGFLLDPAKKTVNLSVGDSSFTANTKRFKADVSLGLFPDGDPESLLTLGAPTPGAANDLEGEGGDPGTPGSFIRGDADGDGEIGLLDLNLLTRVVNGGAAPPACSKRLDADDDGKIDALDVTYLGDFLYRHGSPFPPPYPSAGVDPTSDSLPCPAGS